MNPSGSKSQEKLRDRLNLVLIALMCATTLAPCVLFYVRGAGAFLWLLVLIAICYLVSRLPGSFYDRLQCSTDLRFYKRLGVDQFKRLATNGDLINHRIRKKYPTHRNVTNVQSIREKLHETYRIERSHTVLFVFCLLTSIYAFWTGSYGTALLLFFGNILFNMYPNLLQQYNRIRYKRVVDNYA